LKGKNHLEDPGVDGRNIKIDLQELGWGGMDLFDLAEDRVRWWAPLNAVMNLWIP
jgi:hypothetical protein